MSLKGSKRIRESTIKNYLIGGGVSIPIVIGLFVLLLNQGNTVDSYEANKYCGGDTVCYLKLYNLCIAQDTFIYPMNGSELINAVPGDMVTDVHVFRQWGKGMREYPLNETCSGTWCGGKPNTDNAFSFALRKGKCYNITIELKKPEYSQVNWSINPSGSWEPIPSERGFNITQLYDIAKENDCVGKACTYEIAQENKYSYKYELKEIRDEKGVVKYKKDIKNATFEIVAEKLK